MALLPFGASARSASWSWCKGLWSFVYSSSCNLSRPPFRVSFMGRRSDTHPQPVQVLGSDNPLRYQLSPYSNPVASLVAPARIPSKHSPQCKPRSSCLPADVVTVGALVNNNAPVIFCAIIKSLLFGCGVTGFRPHCMNNSPGRRTGGFFRWQCAACHSVMGDKGSSSGADCGRGRLESGGFQILLDVADFGCVLPHTVKHKADMLAV